jgi:hypothetical protein
VADLVVITVAELRALVVEAVADALAEAGPVADRAALLDRAGLARALGVSLATIDRLRGEGMPELRLGDVPRFELDRVLAWLRERSASAHPAEGPANDNAENTPETLSNGAISGTGFLAAPRKSAKSHGVTR